MDENAQEEAYRLFEEGYKKQTSGELDEAVSCYKRSIKLQPTAEAHTFLGWAYSMQGMIDDAIEECRQAIAIDPEYGNPYNDIGSYLIEKGALDAAVPWLEKAAKAKRYESYCYPYYNLGTIWEKKGEWKKADACYRSSLRENSDYKLAQKALNRLSGSMN